MLQVGHQTGWVVSGHLIINCIIADLKKMKFMYHLLYVLCYYAICERVTYICQVDYVLDEKDSCITCSITTRNGKVAQP